MAQLVFEFVSHDIDAVATAVKKVVGATPQGCQIAREFLDYEPCASFDDAIAVMRAGEAVSVSVRPAVENIRYALVNEPHFDGSKLAAWFGTIEYTSTDYAHIWDELLTVESLRVVCLGAEEGVDLDDVEHLCAAVFPWDDFCLVIGAVRDSTGAWEIRRGSNYFPSEEVKRPKLIARLLQASEKSSPHWPVSTEFFRNLLERALSQSEWLGRRRDRHRWR